MGVAIEVFAWYRYDSAQNGCHHDLLLRVRRPGFTNADQGAVNAAEAFADSCLAHLRSWWAGWMLKRDCPVDHAIAELGVMHEVPAGDELFGSGLRTLDVWVAPTSYGSPWVVFGTAETEEGFWEEILDDEDLTALGPRAPASRHRVFLLTDQDGRLNLGGGE